MIVCLHIVLHCHILSISHISANKAAKEDAEKLKEDDGNTDSSNNANVSYKDIL